jgi:hypothetical protein
MSNLNVITWNSTGETQQGALDLYSVINYEVARMWQPHVIVVQEAKQAAGGEIYNMLQALGPAYNQPPSHAVEGGPYGRGYLMLTYRTVQFQTPFVRLDLGQDQTLLQLINNLPPQHKNTALQQLAAMRMPAGAVLLFGGATVPFVTWHVPRGPGVLLQGFTLQGGANPDAFWFLQNSGFYQQITNPGQNNLGVIAGDLNITVQEINGRTGHPALEEVLPGWDGVSDRLDHIVGHPQSGQPPPTFPYAGNYAASGTHNILVGQVSW